MNTSHPTVDRHLRAAKTWKKESLKLREILLASALKEEWKWNKPCYTYEKANLVVLCLLKESCALGFLKGSLLKNGEGLLVKPGESSQSMRWMKFTSIGEIVEKESILKATLQEAIAAEKAGLQVAFKEKHDLNFPEEFLRKMKSNAALKAAFHALTPGRQRGYSLYFSSAKQPQTREARVEKWIPAILNGRGLQDPPVTNVSVRKKARAAR